MVRVVVSGICGRMGSIVARAIATADGTALVCGVEAPGHGRSGASLREVLGDWAPDVPLRTSLGDVEADAFDVIVDFSVPRQAAECARIAGALGKGLVVGTTALTETETAVIEEAAGTCSVVVAPNTSVGVNVLFGLTSRAFAALGDDYDVEIVETHHRAKRDAPSGTARRLTEILARARGKKPDELVRAGRSGSDAARKAGEIGVHSVRAGSIVGRHSVHFVSELESVTLTHEAFSREAFAAGAVRAARFVASGEPGIHEMSEVLGLPTAGGRRGVEE